MYLHIVIKLTTDKQFYFENLRYKSIVSQNIPPISYWIHAEMFANNGYGLFTLRNGQLYCDYIW
jgi:hypothetical protein